MTAHATPLDAEPFQQGPQGTDLDLEVLRRVDPDGLLEGADRVLVWSTPMTTRFRGLVSRDGLLLHGPAGWGEVAPFWGYDARTCAPWLAAGLEAATCGDGLALHRVEVPVNVTVPEVTPERAHEIVSASGASTAKVKIAGAALAPRASGSRPSGASRPSGSPDDAAASHRADLARLEAVRDALGASGSVRVDVNGAWDLETALALLPQVDRASGGLEYVEQPCARVEDLAALRRALDVPVAADESLRLSAHPLAVRDLEAADLAVLKVAPLGGVRRCLALAQVLGLPAVVSSALDTSVGIWQGVRLAAALPVMEHACGLGTVTLLRDDVADPSLLPLRGIIAVTPPEVSADRVAAAQRCVGEDLTARWQERLAEMLAALTQRRRREQDDPTTVIGVTL